MSLYRRQACLYTEGTHYIRGKTLLYAHGSNAPEINPVRVKFDEYYLIYYIQHPMLIIALLVKATSRGAGVVLV